MDQERVMNITEASERLADLPDQFEIDQAKGENPTVKVTRGGLPVLAILPYDLYEALVRYAYNATGGDDN